MILCSSPQYMCILVLLLGWYVTIMKLYMLLLLQDRSLEEFWESAVEVLLRLIFLVQYIKQLSMKANTQASNICSTRG